TCPSLPMPSKTPAATTRRSFSTAVARDRTSGVAGPSICYSARSEAVNDFDKAARISARFFDGEGFFRWQLGNPFFQAWQWLGWLDTQSIPFPGEPDRRLDVVAAFRRRAADAPPLAVVVKFLSQPRRAVLERLTEYTLRLRRELPYETDPWVPYDVVGVLIN